MDVEVLFFASLRDAVGIERTSVKLTGPAGLRELLAELAQRLPASAIAALQAENIRVAVNQILASPPFAFSDGDEIAFLPPVTGG